MKNLEYFLSFTAAILATAITFLGTPIPWWFVCSLWYCGQMLHAYGPAQQEM